MIANGEDIVRVSRLLGHESPKITLDVYAHMLRDDHCESAERLSQLVFGAEQPHNERSRNGQSHLDR